MAAKSIIAGQRILVIFPGSLGDFICFLPTLDALGTEYPRAEIAVMGRSDVIELVVTETHSLHRQEVTMLFRNEPDMEEARRFFARFSAIYSWMGKGCFPFTANLCRVAAGEVHLFPFLTGDGAVHVSDEYCAYLKKSRATPPRLSLSAAAESWAQEWWDKRALLSQRVLFIHPGSGSRRKRWSPQGFSRVAAWWKERYGEVVVLLGPAEEGEESGWREFFVLQNPSPPRLAAVIARGNLYLGNDSGVSHLAGSVGAQGAVIFGPTNPQRWRPMGGQLEVIAAPNRSIATGEDGFISLSQVSPESVMTVLAALVNRRLDMEGVSYYW